MENKIIEGDKHNNNDFFETNYEDEKMADKYAELYKYLVEDEYGIRHDLDKLKQYYSTDKDKDLLVYSIFAVNFWLKKEKNKNKNKIDITGINVIEEKEEEENDFCLLNDDNKSNKKGKKVININAIEEEKEGKGEEKENEIKCMLEATKYNVKSYNVKNTSYDHDIQQEIDAVNSIEKIFWAFMSVNPELFDIKKFDDFMNMSNEDYAEFYNAIWAALFVSQLKLIGKYKVFLGNNKTLDIITEKDKTHRNLFKIDLILNENDLEKIEARIQEISKLQSYICALDNFFKPESYSVNEAFYTGSKITSIKEVLKLSSDQLAKKQNDDNRGVPLIDGCLQVKRMKDSDISKIINNLKNPPEQEIKNKLEEKILWDNECTIEKREDFFKITATTDEMRKKYSEHMEFVKKNSIFADLETPINNVVKRFSDVNPGLQLKDKKNKENKLEITIEGELRQRYKDVHVATFAVNHFHKDIQKISDDDKIDESIAVMHTLEIDKDAPIIDLNKAACTIEKVFLAFMDVDIKNFGIKRFDAFVKMKSETYMEIIEIVTASTHAYKFIEKYQEFLDANEEIDEEIEKLRKIKPPCAFYQTEKDLENAINDYKKSKINLALGKSDFEKVKKRIDKFSSFAEYFYALKNMFDNNMSNSYACYLLKKDENQFNAYSNVTDKEKNEELDSFLKSLLTKKNDELKSIFFDRNKLLSGLSYYLMCVKKNMPNVLFNSEKLQMEQKIVNELREKINVEKKINNKKLDEENIKLIKDSYQKIAENVFNKKYEQYDYYDCVKEFQEAGKQEAQKEIDKVKGTIAGEFIEDKKANVQNKIKQFNKTIEDMKGKNENYESYKKDLNKYQKKMECIEQYEKDKKVPVIFVGDKYFNFQSEYTACNEKLYQNSKITLFDENNKFIVKQKGNTCYFMSVFIGLISQGMGRHIQRNIIREYEKDTTKAVVRLFDENGCPVDFVVDKTKPKDDTRPLWINMLEKAASVMMNKTQFKKSEGRGGHGAQIIVDVDWKTLAEKQQKNDEIFEESTFSSLDIANGSESVGIQMILGKACKNKITGKVGRKIRYAKEGDEALGFLSEVLSKGKLVIGSTYHIAEEEDENKEIPYNDNGCDYVGFAPGFKIPGIHVVYFESIDLESQVITTIDSMTRKQTISFADFKRHFFDIYVTDFPEEAEILKKQEQQEELAKKANGMIDTINKYFDDLKLKELKELKEFITDEKNELKIIQESIKQNCESLDKYKSEFDDKDKGTELGIKNLSDSISQFKNATDQSRIEINTRKNDVCNKMNVKIKDLDNEILRFDSAITNINGNLDETKRTINNDMENVNKSKENINILMTQAEKELNINNIKLLSLDELNNAQKLINDTVKTRIQDLENKLQSITEQVLSAIQTIVDTKTNLEGKIIDDNFINTTKEKILQERESCSAEIEKLNNLKLDSSEQKKLKATIEELRNKIGGYEKEMSTIDKSIVKLNRMKQNIKDQIKTCLDKADNIQRLDKLNTMKENLVKLTDDPNATTELKKLIETNLGELQTKTDDFQKQINTSLKTLNDLEDNLENTEQNIKTLDSTKEKFQKQIEASLKTLNDLEDNLENAEQNIKTLDNTKENFQKQINTSLKTLNDLEDNLKNTEQNIKKLDSTKEKFQKQVDQQVQDKKASSNRYIQQKSQKLKEIKDKIVYIQNELNEAIMEKYNITSNKMKRYGIIAAILGVFGIILILVIPIVKIVFIVIPSLFALFGVILLGMYSYREIKKPFLVINLSIQSKDSVIDVNLDLKKCKETVQNQDVNNKDLNLN